MTESECMKKMSLQLFETFKMFRRAKGVFYGNTNEGLNEVDLGLRFTFEFDVARVHCRHRGNRVCPSGSVVLVELSPAAHRYILLLVSNLH